MTHPIGFAYVYLFKDLRGITRYTIDICNILSLKSNQVSVICPYRRDRLPRDFLDKDIRLIYIPHYRYKRLTTVPGFLWVFLTKRFHEVNISLGFGEAYAAVIAKRIRKDFRYNVLLHMPYEKDYGLFSKLYERGRRIGLFESADKMIAVSHYVKKSIEGMVDIKRTEVFHNGVDLEQYYFDEGLRKKAREELGIGKEEIVLLTTSAIEERKNIKNIFPVIRTLLDSGLKIRYLIAGYGSTRNLEGLGKEIKHFGLEREVIYLGEKKYPMSLYNAADIFILLSQYEAFGISVIEAAACGLPCITSDESAFPEIVNKDIGFRVGKDDTEGMVEILRALKDKKDREPYRLTARARVDACFNIQKNALLFYEAGLKKGGINALELD
ncbi:MAG: glycosyltransferase family 4 protein [bacterium]